MALLDDLKNEGYDVSQITPELIKQLHDEGFDTTSLQPQGRNVLKDMVPGGQLMDAFTGAPEEVQRGIATTAGAEAGAPFGPLAAGAGAAAMGGLTEAAQNPRTAAQYLKPAADMVFNPNAASLTDAISTVQNNAADIKDFGKRRAVEFGTAAATAGLAKAARNVKVQGPITAGMKDPRMVSEAARKGVLQELGMAKTAARIGDDAAEASRLRRMLSIGQAGKVKLAEEAIEAVNKGGQLTPTQLLAYDEALGKVMTKGGTFANDYANAQKAIRAMLKQQAPNVSKFKTLARNVFLAEGGDEVPVASLIDAVRNPIGAATKFSGVGRVAGALGRTAAEAAIPAGQMVAQGLERLTRKKQRAK